MKFRNGDIVRFWHPNACRNGSLVKRLNELPRSGPDVMLDLAFHEAKAALEADRWYFGVVCEGPTTRLDPGVCYEPGSPERPCPVFGTMVSVAYLDMVEGEPRRCWVEAPAKMMHRVEPINLGSQ